MFFRKSRTRRAREAVAEQVTDRTDDLVAALETAREAIARASTAAGRKSAELGKEAGRKSAELGKEAGRRGATAGRRGARAAREMAGSLEAEQVADLTRKAADKLFPERAKQRRQAARRRRRRLLAGAAGLLGAGLVAGWLTAPKRGAETRQALKDQAAKAGEKGWEQVSESRSEDAGPAREDAEVTPLHQGNGAATNPTRPPT
jgi:hypothetical protein